MRQSRIRASETEVSGDFAACFMDSLTTLSYPATGFSILYEYGLFKQKIIDGNQVELPDTWLEGGDG